MRPAATLFAAVSVLALAGPAFAQTPSGQASGMRYLSWNDRPQPTQAAPAETGRADGMRRPNMVIPHGGFSQAEAQRPGLTPSPNGRQGGLTPANAWLNGRTAMPAQPQPVARTLPAPAPAPVHTPAPAAPRAEEEVVYAAPPASQIEAPRELTPPNYPDYLPGRGYRQYTPGETIMPVRPEAAPVYHQEDNQPARPQTAPHAEGRPTYQPQAYQPQPQPQPMMAPQAQPAPMQAAPEPTQPAPQPTPQADPGFDPMAPRRDAPIFRIQQQQAAAQPPAPAPQAAPASTQRQPTPEAAPQPRRVAMVTPNAADNPGRDQGARYYSVHRQNGQQPDGIAIPQPTYIDALAVNLSETPASQDLAAPDPGPTLIRDNQGRLRAAPAASNGDHQ